MEKRITDVKIQRKSNGSYMVTIPQEIAKDLHLVVGEKMDVYCDKSKGKMCYRRR